MIDIAPTVLEAAGIPEPQFVNGVMQSPYEGTSMCYLFNDGQALEEHDLQYFGRWSATGASITRGGAPSPHRTPGISSVNLHRSMRTSGSCTTGPVISRKLGIFHLRIQNG